MFGILEEIFMFRNPLPVIRNPLNTKYLINYFFRAMPEMFQGTMEKHLIGNHAADYTFCSTIRDLIENSGKIQELESELKDKEGEISYSYEEGFDDGYSRRKHEKEVEATKIESIDLSHMTDWNKK